MCNGKPCRSCKGCASNADGQDYDPTQIAKWINKYVGGGNLSGDSLQEAYVKTMVYLEENKLPFTEGSISSKAGELKVVINDPDYLDKKDDSIKKKIWFLIVIFGIIFLALYFIYKGEISSPVEINASPAPQPVPVPPVVPEPIPPVAPAQTTL